MSIKNAFQNFAWSSIELLPYQVRVQRLAEQLAEDMPGLGMFVVDSCKNTRDVEGVGLRMVQFNQRWLAYNEESRFWALREFFLAIQNAPGVTTYNCTPDEDQYTGKAVDEKNLVTIIKLEPDLTKPNGTMVERRASIAPDCLNPGLDMRLWRAFCDEEALGHVLFKHLVSTGTCTGAMPLLNGKTEKLFEPTSFDASVAHAFAVMRIYETYGKASLPFLHNMVDLARVGQLSECISIEERVYDTDEFLPSAAFLGHMVDEAMVKAIKHAELCFSGKPLAAGQQSMNLLRMLQQAEDIAVKSVMTRAGLSDLERHLNKLRKSMRETHMPIWELPQHLQNLLGVDYITAYQSSIMPYKGLLSEADMFAEESACLWARMELTLYNQDEWNDYQDRAHLTRLLAQEILLQNGLKPSSVRGWPSLKMLSETIKCISPHHFEFANTARGYLSSLGEATLKRYTQPKEAQLYARLLTNSEKIDRLTTLFEDGVCHYEGFADKKAFVPITLQPPRRH